MAALFRAGKSTPAIRAMYIVLPLTLPLLMFWIGANDANHTFAMNDLALITQFFH